MTYGPEIEVNGKRPAWLADGEILAFYESGPEWYGLGSIKWTELEIVRWPSVTKIRLPADHWANAVIEQGFEPWAGGDTAPDDWDGEVLFRSGEIFSGGGVADWKHHALQSTADIIGYRKKGAAMREKLEEAEKGGLFGDGVEFDEKQYIKEYMGDFPGGFTTWEDDDGIIWTKGPQGDKLRYNGFIGGASHGVFNVRDGIVQGECTDHMQHRGFEPEISKDVLESWIDVWPKGSPASLGHVSPAVDPRDAEIAALNEQVEVLKAELAAARAKHPDLVPDPDRGLKDEILAFGKDKKWICEDVEWNRPSSCCAAAVYAWEKRK